MFCPKCGRELEEGTVFCPKCGFNLEGGENADASTSKVKKGSNKKIIAIVIICILGIGGISGFLYFYNTPDSKYNRAETAFEKGDYQKAVNNYKALGDYKDAADKLKDAEIALHYVTGKEYMEQGDYEQAKNELTESDKYEDSKELLRECNYNIGLQKKDTGDYENAALAFKDSASFKDANDQIINMGQDLTEKGEYDKAVTVFDCVKNLGDNQYANYSKGVVSSGKKDYSTAANCFSKAGDYKDAKELYKDAQYSYARDQLDKKEYSTAKSAFIKIKKYKDSKKMISACSMMMAKEAMDDGKLNDAKKKMQGVKNNVEYNGVSAKDINEKLAANAAWLGICGTWTSTSGQASTEEVSRTTGYNMGGWTLDVDSGDYTLKITCKPNNDGTVNVKGEGSIPVFTNWSSIQIGLDCDRNHSISFNEKVSTANIGSPVQINSDTTITLSPSGITVNYLKKDTTSSVYFSETYKTWVSYARSGAY